MMERYAQGSKIGHHVLSQIEESRRAWHKNGNQYDKTAISGQLRDCRHASVVCGTRDAYESITAKQEICSCIIMFISISAGIGCGGSKQVSKQTPAMILHQHQLMLAWLDVWPLVVPIIECVSYVFYTQTFESKLQKSEDVLSSQAES